MYHHYINLSYKFVLNDFTITVFKVQQDDINDNLLAKKIAEKIGESPGISYTEIASKALDRGRTSLAIKVGWKNIFVSLH